MKTDYKPGDLIEVDGVAYKIRVVEVQTTMTNGRLDWVTNVRTDPLADEWIDITIRPGRRRADRPIEDCGHCWAEDHGEPQHRS